MGYRLRELDEKGKQLKLTLEVEGGVVNARIANVSGPLPAPRSGG